MDIFAVPLQGRVDDIGLPIHGGEMDTSLLLYIDADLVDLAQAEDYTPSPGAIRKYRSGRSGAIPKDSPGSVGHPSRASTETGKRLYHYIYERIAQRVFGRPTAKA